MIYTLFDINIFDKHPSKCVIKQYVGNAKLAKALFWTKLYNGDTVSQ